jgi:hypothetical protein
MGYPASHYSASPVPDYSSWCPLTVVATGIRLPLTQRRRPSATRPDGLVALQRQNLRGMRSEVHCMIIDASM